MAETEKKPRHVCAHVRVHGLEASVEARERKGSGKAVILLDETGQHVVSVSPTAWQCGVRDGMSRWEAEQRCPEVLAVEPNPEKYRYFWQRVVEVCGDYTPRLLQDRGGGAGDKLLRSGADISLDLTGTERLFGPAKSIAQEIRNRLRAELKLTASVGIGPNRMVARLACESAEPGEVVEVGQNEAAEFVGALPILALPGVDEDWAQRLDDMGLRRAKDLAKLPEDAVKRALGEWGRRLWEIARGSDPQEGDSGASPGRLWESDTFSVQFDLRPPTDERGRIRAALRAVSEEIGRRLRQRGQVAQRIKVTFVFRDMRKVGARRTLGRTTRSGEVIFRAAMALFDRMKMGGRPVKRVRISVGRLAIGPKGGQLGLPLIEQETRRQRLADLVDLVKDRYGESAVERASTLTLAGSQVSGPGTNV